MRKFIVYTSALVLAGGISYAMDEEAMDKEMMMEAPAPSVSVGGSAAMGFESVSGEMVNGEDHENDGINLVREYKVSFSSSGTTDGGLMFGAGISIEDTHDDDPHQDVNSASVYVGGSDGSWKLQLGGNDPGIDVVGGIGVADDHFDGEDDKTIALSGSIGGAEYRISMADPQLEAPDNAAADGDWSAGAKYGLDSVSVGFGMDSESGLALSVGTDVSGVGLSLYYSTSEESETSLAATKTKLMGLHTANKRAADLDALKATLDDNTLVTADLTAYNKNRAFGPSSGFAIDNTGKIENSGIGVSASIPAGEGASLSVSYSKYESEHSTAAKVWFSDTVPMRPNTVSDNPVPVDTNATGTVETEMSRIGISFSYDLGGGATFNAGVEKDETETTYAMNSESNIFRKDSDAEFNEDTNGAKSYSSMEESDKTTLSATLSFSF